MLVNSMTLSTARTGFQTLFNEAFKGAQSYYKEISTDVPSTAREEHYAWLGQFARLREWIGPRVVRNLSVQGYTILNRKFEDTISISRDDFEDDRIGIFSPLVQEMGRNAAQHPDQLIFGLLGTGFTELCYDGQPFFDADHPVILGEDDGPVTSVSNVQAGSGPAWYLIDASRAIRPFIWQQRVPYDFTAMNQPEDYSVFMQDEFLYGVRARVNAGFGLWQLAFGSKDDLTPENYSAARAAMTDFRGDNGQPLGIMPTHLVAPVSLEEAARKTVVNLLDDAGASNTWAGTAKLVVTPWLPSS